MDAAGVHDGTAKSDFDDVVEGSWYESYVASAVAEGIAAGRSENIFGVGEPITRQDVCVMAAKLADGGEDAPELAFDDAADIADYARQSVQKLAGLGVVSGMGDNKFCPTDTCTRAQAAMIVSGILEKK